MLHAVSDHDELFDDKEIPFCSVPKSLRSFVIHHSEQVRASQFLKRLLEVLECLISGIESHGYQFLSHCTNLTSLRLFATSDVDLSFLQSMPKLKYFGFFPQRGLSKEQAVAISRGAPNLASLAILFSPANSSLEYYTSLSSELCQVKRLTVYGMNTVVNQFLKVFLEIHKLFRRVTALQIVSHDAGDPNFSYERRSHCTVSLASPRIEFGLRDQMCLICWERKTPNWTCPRCCSFVFSHL